MLLVHCLAEACGEAYAFTLRKSSERSVCASDKFHVMELNQMQNDHKKQKQQIKDAQNTKLRTAEKFHRKQMKVSERTK